MFVMTNAWGTVARHRWRATGTVLVALVATVGSIFGMAVLHERSLAVGSDYDALAPNAVIRPTQTTLAKRDGADANWTKQYLSWDDYTKYATAMQNKGLQFDYTLAESVPVRATGDLHAVTTSHTTEADAESTGGDFTLRAFYTLDAAHENEFGRYRIVSGKHLRYNGANAKNGALISQELADANHLKVGDSLTVGHPTNPDTTINLTVRGIYEYTGSAPAGYGNDAKYAKDNRNNAIYVTYYTFGSNMLDAADASGWAIPDLNIIFKLSSPTQYDTMVKAVTKAKLPKTHEVTSPVINRYETSIQPLNQLADATRIALITLWIVAGILLLILVTLALRGRTEELAFGLMVGASRARLGWQMMLEVWMLTIPALAVGTALGAWTAGPLGSALTHGHATAATGALVGKTVLYGLGVCLVLALIALMRALMMRDATVFAPRDAALNALDSETDGINAGEPTDIDTKPTDETTYEHRDDNATNDADDTVGNIVSEHEED